MSIAYVDGNAGWGSSSPFTLTLPSDISAGQVVYVYASVFNNATPIGLTGMANPGTLVQMYYGYNGFTDSFMAWAFEVGTGDAGATLTYTETGASTYIGSAIQVYSGASVPPANTNGANTGYAYANGAFVNTDTDNPTAPTISGGTPVAGCWGAFFISAGVGDGDGAATYSGGTLREQSTASGINGFDSNGSLGSAGTTVGGGTFTTVADGPVVMITTVVPPASSGVTVTGATATETLAAPAGSVTVAASVSGATATETFAAPGGAVQVPVTVSGAAATDALAAPAGAVTTDVVVSGAVATETVAAPGGAVSAGATVTGAAATETFTAPAGAVSTPVAVHGGTAPVVLAAGAGSVVVGMSLRLDPFLLGGLVTAASYGGAIVGANMQDITGNGYGGLVS